MINIGILYFRTLYSQSVSSLTVDKIYSTLKQNNICVKQFLLTKEDHYSNLKVVYEIDNIDMIIYKVNYQDFEYGIRLIKSFSAEKNIPVILIGPFACLNKERILEKYPFVTHIFSSNDLNIYLSKILNKNIDTIKCGAKYRQIEEKGKYVNIEYSSGCVYNCTFCHIPLSNGILFRRSAVDVVDEIEYLYHNYSKKYFIFNDPIFWKGKQDTQFIEEFYSLIQQKNLKIYFMIYLALGSNIPQNILVKLKEIGLVRVFFGVENITMDFQKYNPKKTSKDLSNKFINRLTQLNISYHIGFILFYPQLKYDNIIVNLQYLKELNKMFRLGIIKEKMRIIPTSTYNNILDIKNDKVDQAYNYNFFDRKVDSIFREYCKVIDSINYRSFESFFTNIDLLNAMLLHDKIDYKIKDLIDNFSNFKKDINLRLFNIFEKILNKQYIEENIYDIYSEAEYFYLSYIKQLKLRKLEEYLSYIPHGMEKANVPNLFD